MYFIWIPYNNFNPPAPCGAGLALSFAFLCTFVDFNPPAPCGAGRVGRFSIRPFARKFQSTRPVRGGTRPYCDVRDAKDISIHPPRAGRDQRAAGKAHHHQDFNPPAPCGAGQPTQTFTEISEDISIHPPRAGRDITDRRPAEAAKISIHPPRAGRDIGLVMASTQRRYFNPPAPCGAGQYLEDGDGDD